jgi:UDP-N-acetylglucosamine 3-dehydrogenase
MHKIAIIGAGMISYSHANAISNLSNAELIAVCDINEKSAKKLGSENNCQHFTDIETMFYEKKDIGIVIVTVPTFLHEEVVSICAKHNKHILCEKPLELTVEKTKKLLKSVHDAGVVFMTAQVVRFWTGYTEIKQMYDSGELGEVYLAYATRCSEMQSWGNTWLVDPNLGQGAILDMHVHDIDYLRHLLGPVDYVFCAAKKDSTHCFNSAFSTIAFKNGAKSVAQTSFNMQDGYPFSMTLQIIGTLATVEMKYCAGSNIGERDSIDSEIRIFKKGSEQILKKLDLYDGYTKQLEYYLDCVSKNIQPDRVPHDQNLEVIKIACAIRESAETEQKIYIK